MLTGDLQQLGHDAWQPGQQAIGDAEYVLGRFRTEPHRRWANGFSCLAFVMVGVPVAVLLRKGEFLSSFFACFLPILIVYYPLLMLSLDQAKSGNFPPAFVWFGNAVLALAGLWFMRRVVRY
jgi:lipopolysaccharide export system permease protein